MDICEQRFRAQFREVESLSKKLVLDNLSPRDRHLRRMMLFALRQHTPSDYPFLFRYAASRKEEDGATVKNLAAAVHLLQSSSIITDDILDAGSMRFGRPAFHRQYNVNYAIIATELMQSIAFRTFGSELDRGQFKHPCLVMKILNEILRDLYLCQYLDLYYSARTSLSLSKYYRVIGMGAGYFMSNLARCGALLAGKPASEVRALAAYGYNYGMALFITERRAAQVIQDVGAIAQCTRIARRYLARSLRALSRTKSGVSRTNLAWLSTSLLSAQCLD